MANDHRVPKLATERTLSKRRGVVTILICADDAIDRDFLTHTLRSTSVSLHYKSNFTEISKYWLDKPADLVVVSTRENGKSQSLKEGIEQVRHISDVPIILLVEELKEKEAAMLLNAGADLILYYPTSPRIFSSYCHALLRRRGRGELSVLPLLEMERISLNPMTRMVKVSGREGTRLTRLEFLLLYTLMTNPGQVMSPDRIVDLVWGYSESGSRELVRGLVSRLRSKIEQHPSRPEFIHTISGAGYVFDENGDI
jgi:DNA-binding response OmpR family regulator